MDNQVENHQKNIEDSNNDVLNFLREFDWNKINGIENKKQVLRMAIVHSYGEVNYNQKKLFETRNLDWDEEVYNRLYKNTIIIQRELLNIIKTFSIDKDIEEEVNAKCNKKMAESKKDRKNRNLKVLNVSLLLNGFLVLVVLVLIFMIV